MQATPRQGIGSEFSIMTMMNGLETVDLDILDEEFFGPPPRFLVEEHAGSQDTDISAERMEGFGLIPGLGKIKKLMGVW
jgi:hypothetical protein